MGTPSFNEPEITHKSKNMKLIATLAAAATAQQLGAPVNPLMPAMPALPAMPGMGGMNPFMMMTMGGQGGVGQMNPLMLSMLLDDSSDKVDPAKLKKICADLDAGAEKTTCEADLVKVVNPITDAEIDCTAATDATVCADDKKKALAAINALKKSDMSDLLMLSMMSGQGMGDMNSMLPLLLMKDGGLCDNKMLMLMMMQGDNMGAMNPLLMMSLLE